MGRQWCRVDPVVHIDGDAYAVVVGIDGAARDRIRSVGVTLTLPGDVRVSGHHTLFGVPIAIEVLPIDGGDEPAVSLLIAADGAFACAIGFEPRAAGGSLPAMFGAGATNETVEAAVVLPGK